MRVCFVSEIKFSNVTPAGPDSHTSAHGTSEAAAKSRAFI